MKYYFQVPKEVYSDFIKWLNINRITNKQVKDFTTLGQWCLIETCGEYDILDKANNYLEELINEAQ